MYHQTCSTSIARLDQLIWYASVGDRAGNSAGILAKSRERANEIDAGTGRVPNYFSGGFQFCKSVMGEPAEGSASLIRNRPSGATSYWGRPEYVPPKVMFV